MNQEKTGAFIAQLRKESNMTQVQFADELGPRNTQDKTRELCK